MSDPDTIRREIEETRRNLSTDVDALADKVSPNQIVDRQKEKVKGRLRGVQESVMGTVHHAQDKVSSGGHDVSGAAGNASGSFSDTASSVTGTVADKHRGLLMFAVPMDTPGIRVVPIKSIDGKESFEKESSE